MNDNIKDLIDRLRRYQDYALLEPDKLNPLDIMLDCVEAADELEKAYADIEEMNNVDISNSSCGVVEPEKGLFEYCIEDLLIGERIIGIVKANNLDEAARIVKSYSYSSYTTKYINRIYFDDKGLHDIYQHYVG